MKLLDLYCGAGGASRGYQRAGFHVTGVDKKQCGVYGGDEFVLGDAIEYLRERGSEYDAIHASPPCQLWSAYRRKGFGVGDGYENLIDATRELLIEIGKPYIIENVSSARHMLRRPVQICGSAFDLDVQRHRLFETSFKLRGTVCNHSKWTPRFPPATNRDNLRKTVEVGVWRIPLDVQQKAMGIDWMTLKELSQAIPPDYTELIGREMIANGVI